MAHSPEKVAEFRAHYLYSGNASESAKEVGIPESTGRDMARRLMADETFVADRRDLNTGALGELVAMRMRVARKALERFESDKLDIATGGGGDVTVIDKRSEYGRLVIEAERSAHHLAKVEGESKSEHAAGGVVINIQAPEGVEIVDAGNGSDESA